MKKFLILSLFVISVMLNAQSTLRKTYITDATSGDTAEVNASNELKVKDDDTKTSVDTVNTSLGTVNTSINAVETNQTDGTQKTQITDADGHIANINTDGQLHVVARGAIDTNNSTNAVLQGGGKFSGTATETLDFAVISIYVYTNVVSATDGLEIQFSDDGTDWHATDKFTIPANTAKTFTIQPVAQYMRIVYTNGGSVQTHFDLQTILKKTYVKPSSHRIQDSISTDDDAELVKAVITGKNPGGTFVNFTSTNSGNFKVALEEFDNSISTNSNTQLNTTLYDAGGIPVEVDNSSHSLQTITYDHHEIHSGSFYNIQGFTDLAINNVFDMQFTTANTTTWNHFLFELACESETEWFIYEGVTISTAGTAVTPINANRNSANTSGNTVATINNTSVANANADTPTASATLIASGSIGTGRSGGSINRGEEIILKQNTIYCFRAVAISAGKVAFHAKWYEHADKD